MSFLQEAADAVTSAAGWKKAVPDAAGVFHFRLEQDLDMDLFSPDGRTLILRAEVGPLPPAERDADDVLRRCASRAVAAGRKRRSVLTLDGGALILHRLLPREGSLEEMPRHVRDFLNDLTWWKAQAGNGSPAASPFSFAGLQGWGAGR